MPNAIRYHGVTSTQEEVLKMSLQNFAGLASFNLSLEPQLTVILAKISESTWERFFQVSSMWHAYYFAPPEKTLRRLLKSESAKNAFTCDLEISDPKEQFEFVVDRASKCFKEVSEMVAKLSSEAGQVDLDISEPENKEILEELVLVKALLADIRARAFFGQSIFSLVEAGKKGVDEGYFRAASIDSAIQWHPDIIDRISRERLVGISGFADKLRDAAIKGPSKNVSVDLHQLRFVLGLVREFGLLDQMSNAERYEVFFEQLHLYPDTGTEEGKNVKSALCVFIDRWEKSVVG